MMVWRVTRCPKPCDKLPSPLSEMLRQLIIRANETSYSKHHILLAEIESDVLESCKVSKTL